MSKKDNKIKKIDGFAGRLKEAMRKQGPIQAKLSKAINVDSEAIMKWKCGKTNPTIWNLVKICRFLNVSADWLLGLSGNPEISDPIKGEGEE